VCISSWFFGIRFAVADRPAARGLIGLVVPAVEHRKIRVAVESGLHAGGAAGLFAASRIVQPQINALHEFAGDLHRVVLDENEAAEISGSRESWTISRMSVFPGMSFGEPCRR
jgi:hypothetical protein